MAKRPIHGGSRAFSIKKTAKIEKFVKIRFSKTHQTPTNRGFREISMVHAPKSNSTFENASHF